MKPRRKVRKMRRIKADPTRSISAKLKTIGMRDKRNRKAGNRKAEME